MNFYIRRKRNTCRNKGNFFVLVILMWCGDFDHRYGGNVTLLI